MKQMVRIIAGKHRGKKIGFPNIDGLRPTPDRVRETLFNWLMRDVIDARCLDAFAGSGALGFEAYSRGAANVTLIERSPLAYASLKATAAAFNSSSLVVVNDDTFNFLKNTTQQFDIIFLDPPFSQDFIPHCLSMLETVSALKIGGLLYIEAATDPLIENNVWTNIKSKQAGQVFYGLYKKLA